MFDQMGKEGRRSSIYKYKDTFSLKDEIGTCSSIEVEKMLRTKAHFSLDHFMLGKRTKSF